MYKIKEIFTTLQGEGYHTGTAAVFVRFTGCNLWSGLEKDRNKGAGSCSLWCDTDFVGGEKYSLTELVDEIYKIAGRIRYVVFTGGEPLLQLDNQLLEALPDFYTAVETNGTIDPMELELDWICMSPKKGTETVIPIGDEMKVIFPQVGMDYEELYRNHHQDFKHFFIQPMDGLYREMNTALAIQYVKDHPNWRLSIQSHKYLSIP